MEYTDLPSYTDEFNHFELDKRANRFWCSIYVYDNFNIIFQSNIEAIVYYEVNNYFVVVHFIYPLGYANELFKGEIENVYACHDILDLIYKYKKDIWQKWINTPFLVKRDEDLTPEYYLSHYLFIDAPYKEILNRVSSYFFNDFRLSPVDADENLIRSELIHLWNPYAASNSAILYFNNYDISFAGSGIAIHITNSHLQIADDYLAHPVPSIIFDKCTTVPHIVRIEYSRKWAYPEVGNKIMKDLALKFDGKAFMISSDYTVMAVKSNKYLSVEKKIFLLDQHLTSYLTERNLEFYAKQVAEKLGNYWDMLSENSRTFLATGYNLYRFAIDTSACLFDTSLPSLSFAKCIEIEMVFKVILPFKEYFENNYSKDDLNWDLNDVHLKKMALFLAGDIIVPPELGSFAHFLKNAINSKQRASYSGSIKAFKAFCLTRKAPEFFLNEKALCSKLFLISNRYRNGSAHIKILKVEYLLEFYALLFKDGFIAELLESSQARSNYK